MKTLGCVKTLIILMTLLLSACSTTQITVEAAPSGGSTIVCEVFYRSSTGKGLDSAPLITFSDGNDQKIYEFETMVFEARFQDDDYEGHALSIVITNLENGEEITRQLYQFDPQNPVENQFIGGHGFTGLNYVFQPDSSAEMQFFCSLK